MSASVVQDHLRAVQAAMREGDMRRAADAAERAISQGHEHPQLLTLAGYDRLNAGDYERGLALATRACELAPHSIDALNVRGECLTKTGRTAEAIAVFDQALALAPDDAALHFNLAAALEQNGELKRACDEFERSFALDPARADAASRLAFLSATRGDMGRAREFGLRALALDDRQAFASFAVALADIDAKDFAAAQTRMAELANVPRIGRVIRALAQSILGDALHGMGRAPEAFAAYAQAGEAQRVLYAPQPGVEAEMALARAKRFAAAVAKAPAGSWRAKPAPSPVRTHAFVMGFPRSGTTLLAQVLASHPMVAVLAEKRTLTDCAELVASDSGLDRLAAMDEAGLAPFREAYWRRIAEFGQGGAREVLVDEMPLNSELMFLIAKLFPQAKIVFALRDPRDVVFSCFRRRFSMTPQMYELLTLEGAAAYYDAVMSLAETQRRVLGLPIHDLRHENLIADFDGECRRLCAFLQIEHDPGMRDFAARARARDVTTVSAAQVGRGLNASGIGQWRAYVAEMAPVMALLSPWVDGFGYEIR